MYTLGYDVGSSFVKAALLDVKSGELVASASSPDREMPIIAHRNGWAEQDPSIWWENLKLATQRIISLAHIDTRQIEAIGISYQMHGLVVVGEQKEVLRPSIIWCDSRATEIGRRAFDGIGREKCLTHLLNSPGNFTASKLRWVQEEEPDVFTRVKKFLLPGDYIAMRMTGETTTTIPGLSEAMLWDFSSEVPAQVVLDYYAIDNHLIPAIVPTFGRQGTLQRRAAEELGLPESIEVTYRAGDQPNNALSLHVLEPGDVAATAGTSGVVYGVSNSVVFDATSRVNSFVHVNHSSLNPRIGVLLCINGCGITNSWMRSTLGLQSSDYAGLNRLAASAPVGAGGLLVLPFGNGAERMFQDRDIGAHIVNLNFNTHSTSHLLRAVQEGIGCAFAYGIDILKILEITPKVIRAGQANMFLSPIFCETLTQLTGVSIELYNTDGAQGAARGAAIGKGFYSTTQDSFKGVARTRVFEPKMSQREEFLEQYGHWKTALQTIVNSRK